MGAKNATRTTIALLLVGVYALMWAWIIYDVVLVDNDCTDNCLTAEASLAKLGDFVGVISTMTVLVTLVVQFYFRRSNPQDHESIRETIARLNLEGKLTDEEVEKKKKLFGL